MKALITARMQQSCTGDDRSRDFDDEHGGHVRSLQRHPLRAGDAIQLASCLHLQEYVEEDLTFVGFAAL